MNASLIILFSEIFTKIEEQGKDGFLLIKLSVPMKILFELYERLVKVDVEPIETIRTELKSKFWEIGKKYHTDEQTAIKASKAAYMLSLITNV